MTTAAGLPEVENVVMLYLIEAANARHEHEYALWEHVKLPAG